MLKVDIYNQKSQILLPKERMFKAFLHWLHFTDLEATIFYLQSMDLL